MSLLNTNTILFTTSGGVVHMFVRGHKLAPNTCNTDNRDWASIGLKETAEIPVYFLDVWCGSLKGDNFGGSN